MADIQQLECGIFAKKMQNEWAHMKFRVLGVDLPSDEVFRQLISFDDSYDAVWFYQIDPDGRSIEIIKVSADSGHEVQYLDPAIMFDTTPMAARVKEAANHPIKERTMKTTYTFGKQTIEFIPTEGATGYQGAITIKQLSTLLHQKSIKFEIQELRSDGSVTHPMHPMMAQVLRDADLDGTVEVRFNSKKVTFLRIINIEQEGVDTLAGAMLSLAAAIRSGNTTAAQTALEQLERLTKQEEPMKTAPTATPAQLTVAPTEETKPAPAVEHELPPAPRVVNQEEKPAPRTMATDPVGQLGSYNTNRNRAASADEAKDTPKAKWDRYCKQVGYAWDALSREAANQAVIDGIVGNDMDICTRVRGQLRNFVSQLGAAIKSYGDAGQDLFKLYIKKVDSLDVKFRNLMVDRGWWDEEVTIIDENGKEYTEKQTTLEHIFKGMLYDKLLHMTGAKQVPIAAKAFVNKQMSAIKATFIQYKNWIVSEYKRGRGTINSSDSWYKHLWQYVKGVLYAIGAATGWTVLYQWLKLKFGELLATKAFNSFKSSAASEGMPAPAVC